MHLEIVPMTKEDLNLFMLTHAAKEGWDYSSEDVEAYYAINGNGFSLLKVDGRPAGCILVTKYIFDKPNVSLLSVGLFLVTSQYRGKGQAGPQLWEKSVSENLQTFICCLSSVPRTIGFYERNGFYKTQLTNAHYKLLMSNYSITKLNIMRNLIDLDIIQSLSDENFNTVEKYESNLFGDGANTIGRQRFREIWLKRPDAITLLYLNSGKLEGYGVATICKREKTEKSESDTILYRLSPVYADTIDVASKILSSLLHLTIEKRGKSIELYTPVYNSALSDMFEDFKFKKLTDGDTFLMVNKNHLPHNSIPCLEKVIALAPLEFPHEAILDINTPSSPKL